MLIRKITSIKVSAIGLNGSGQQCDFDGFRTGRPMSCPDVRQNRAVQWLESATIDQPVLDLRPDYRAVLIVADGLEPGPSDDASAALLLDAEARAAALLDGHAPEELEPVAQWREAYRAFGAKPQSTRPSVEALLRRVDGGLPRVDRLTDAYNAVSITHLLPIGGEDLSGYAGPARLVRAAGDEPFDTTSNGEPVLEHPEPGEVIWRDDAGVTCRRWNWRQCTRTRITAATTRAVFILDGLGECDLQAAADALVSDLSMISPKATFERYSPTVISTRSG
jgi:DNA/RNA-binding domain of Phe-tRNA-synthetase-like protein